MAKTEVPTLFLIHGGGHGDPIFFQKFQTELDKAGIPSEGGTQPSNGGFPPPGRALYDDAEYWHGKIKRLVDEGKEVVVLMHSLAGIIGTEAINGLTKTERASNSLPGGVLHLVYIAAYLPDDGDCTFTFYGEGSLLSKRVELLTADNGVDICILDPFAKYYYSDLPAEEHQHWVQYLKHIPVELFSQPISHAAWKDVPTSWILTEFDQVILAEVQRQMISDAKEKHGVEISTYPVPSGHSPFLNMPDRLVDVIQEIYQKIKE